MSSAKRERRLSAKAKASTDRTPRTVKENLSTENKIHLILHPVPEAELFEFEEFSIAPGSPTPGELLGKRKREQGNSPKQRKQAKVDSTEPADDEFVAPVGSDENVSDVSDDELGFSSDEEIKITRKKNKKLTRRQKAMNTPIIHNNGLMALPMESEKKPMTEEMKNRKSEQARKRKRLAERQAEEEKVGRASRPYILSILTFKC